MMDLIPDNTEIGTVVYDVFITETDENNVIKRYSAYEDKYNISIEHIVHFKIECQELPDYENNYKLISNRLIELSEEEKPTIKMQPTELELLRQEKEILAQSVYDLTTIVELILIGGIIE